MRYSEGDRWWGQDDTDAARRNSTAIRIPDNPGRPLIPEMFTDAWLIANDARNEIAGIFILRNFADLF